MSSLLMSGRASLMSDTKAVLTECGSRFYEIRDAGGKLDTLAFSRQIGGSDVPFQFDYPFCVYEFKTSIADNFGIRGGGHESDVWIHYVETQNKSTGQLSVMQCKALIADALDNRLMSELFTNIGSGYRVKSSEFGYDDSEENLKNAASNEAASKFVTGTLKLKMLVCESR